MAPRAAAAAVRRVASTARSAAAAPPRPAAIHHAGPRAAAPPSKATAIHHARPRSAAPPRAVTPHSAVAIHHASSSVAPTRSAASPPSAVAIHHASSVAATRSATGIPPPAGNLATDRFGARYSRLTGATPYPFKIHRRFKSSQRKTIPEEVHSELQRIEADGLKRHKELQQSILTLTTQVAERSANAKANKVEATWQMGKTAWTVCSTVLATAAVSGCAVLQFVKFGWGRDSQDAASVMLDAKISELKEGLENRMDAILGEKEKDEAAALSRKTLELDEKAKFLDKKEADLKAREAAVAAKEAAAKQPPKK